MKINLSLMRVASWAAGFGVTRLIPGIAQSDAMQSGTLSDQEKEMYGAVFYSRTATVTMIHEIVTVQENAKTVENTGVSQLTMLFFLSDGSVGTGFDEETWGKIPKEYISQLDNGECIELPSFCSQL